MLITVADAPCRLPHFESLHRQTGKGPERTREEQRIGKEDLRAGQQVDRGGEKALEKRMEEMKKKREASK